MIIFISSFAITSLSSYLCYRIGAINCAKRFLSIDLDTPRAVYIDYILRVRVVARGGRHPDRAKMFKVIRNYD